MEDSRRRRNSLSVTARASTSEVFPAVYDELRRLAARYLQRQGRATSVDPTAIVHEAFIRLAGDRRWKGRAHFVGVAAMTMRGILVDKARRRAAQKRGGRRRRLRLSSQCLPAQQPIDALTIHELLDQLANVNARQAKVVELRFFGGLSIHETAQILDSADSTVERDWRFARAWLSARLRDSGIS